MDTIRNEMKFCREETGAGHVDRETRKETALDLLYSWRNRSNRLLHRRVRPCRPHLWGYQAGTGLCTQCMLLWTVDMQEDWS